MATTIGHGPCRALTVRTPLFSNGAVRQGHGHTIATNRSTIRSVSQLRTGHSVTKSLELSSSSQVAATTSTDLRITLDTAEAIQAIRFAAIPTKQGADIVLSEVSPGSSAEQAGLKVGQKLLGLSDPVRQDIWMLNERASLRFVRDAFRMRRSDSVDLLVSDQPVLLRDLEGLTGSMSLVSSSSSSSTDSEYDSDSADTDDGVVEASVSLIGLLDQTPGMTIREQLERKYKTSQVQLSAYQRRKQRRREYLSDQSGRGSSVFLLVGGLFLVPPLAILWVAYSSGYLDSLASNSY